MKKFISLSLALISSSSYGTLGEIAQSACRRKIMDRSSVEKLFSPIQTVDRAEDLVDNGLQIERNLLQMEKRKLTEGRTKTPPWSDSYWPIAKGGLGQRYQDEEASLYDWQDAFNYVQKHPASQLIAQKKQDTLSPAEKYDLLIGDLNFPFTKSEWTIGQSYLNNSGRVEGWMGSCHGWAAASIMMAEPRKGIDVSVGGQNLHFYPSDLKGLATGLWAKGGFEIRFIGGRCNAAEPSRDRYDRERDRNCLDTNPGTWHLSVVNQIGLSGRSFVMDARSTYEVWNHPVFAYTYKYYNLKTEKVSADFKESVLKIQDWDDPRKSLRAEGTRYLVGVRMVVQYGVENDPSTQENQEELNVEEEYDYDLELDENYNILGGEWYSSHPDFLWVPSPRTFPGGSSAAIDPSLIPVAVKEGAKVLAKKGGLHGGIVKGLIKRSSEN